MANGTTMPEKLLQWVDDRFPLVETWKYHLAEYYAPKNFNFWYYFGGLAVLVLVIQIVTGIFLTMNYKPVGGSGVRLGRVHHARCVLGLDDPVHAFHRRVVFLRRRLPAHVPRAALRIPPQAARTALDLRLFHLPRADGRGFLGLSAALGTDVVLGRAGDREPLWSIPVIGPDLAVWIRGDFVVGDATLNRFFAFHVIAVPLVLLGLVFVHLIALHEVGSNNPDGIEIKKNKDPKTGVPMDGIPFHPYYTVKDIAGIVAFLIIFCAVVFFAPEMGGYFLEYNNFIPADPLKTPLHIAPVWYFTPFYAMLRAVPAMFGSQFAGVAVMGAAVVILFFLPWLDRSPVRSIRYRGPVYKTALTLFVISFVVLGWLGIEAPTPLYTWMARVLTVVYFAFFLLMPWYSRIDSVKQEPKRVT